MLTVTEASFARQVLRAPTPALVCFGLRACPGRRALLPALEAIAEGAAGRLLVATAIVDQAPLLAEAYGVTASPTLLGFAGGEPQGRVVGFLPAGLMRLFADAVARDMVAGDTLWSPVEELFEDTVLIPLLQGWGLSVRRQVSCATGAGPRQRRGRVDLLVYDQAMAQPFTLIESKRLIRGDYDLREAAAQAAAYAESFALASFIVAAPRGMWIYRRAGGRATCVRHLSSLELAQQPDLAQRLMLQLRSGG